jgi:signal transduction histidine kinase
MTYWLRGKWGALLAFMVIAGLVTGGLGWVTAEVLRLEQEQIQSRAEAELAGKLRIALWQLDSFILPDLSREDGRPFSHYLENPSATRSDDSPLAASKLPEWVLFHFQWDEKGWRSPQLSAPDEEKGNADPKKTAIRSQAARDRRFLSELQAQLSFKSILARLHEGPTKLLFNDNSLVVVAPPDLQRGQQAGPSQRGQQVAQGDYEKRLNYQNQIRNAPFPRPLAVKLSRPMIPLWLTAADGADRLLLVREAQVGTSQIVQGLAVDWPRLQAVLAAQVADFFPNAHFVPIRDKVLPNPERALTALPIELDPGVAASQAPRHGWTPLRIGLAVAWIAVGLALLATFVGGWSLLDVSERRSRFVSAVTHELRTPLTTLRLYLDMLTNGMVQDESRKAEYLATLHGEADRLNRLIGNVLDFSRLEKQTPRLEMRPTSVAEMLEQVRSTWQSRCRDVGKELVIDNSAGAEATLSTDASVVLQIVGNLIDNACKYSRDAADPCIRLRAGLDRHYLALSVEDGGPGIPPSERRAIFRPFRRGRSADVTAGGVGLGLALARRWAGLLGGTLTLRTETGKPGACFRLDLPASREHVGDLQSAERS